MAIHPGGISRINIEMTLLAGWFPVMERWKIGLIGVCLEPDPGINKMEQRRGARITIASNPTSPNT